MRIATTLIIAFSLSAFGGLGVATLIDHGYHQLRDLEEIAARQSLAVARLRGFGEAVDRALESVDLAAKRPDNPTIAQARKELDGLASGAEELVHYPEIGADASTLGEVREAIVRLNAVVGSTDGKPVAGSPTPLSGYQTTATGLAAIIRGLEATASRSAASTRREVERHEARRQRSDPLLISAYAIFMLLILATLLRQIARPLLRLTLKAEDAIELGHRFQPERRGPSEIRQLGDTIGRLVDDLEATVSERTAALEDQANALREEVGTRQRVEKRLRSAVREAEAASQAKSEFLSVISHELRTPMNAILGTLTLLDDTRLSNEQRIYLETSRESGEALMTLLNDVLDLSKIEAGGLQLVEQSFDLMEVIDHVLSIFHTKCCAKDIVLSASIGPDVPRRLVGDPLRLRQVMTNLAGNAVKFTDRGRVQLIARVDRDRDGRPLLRLTVADTGIGIAEKDQAEIFAEFTQVDPSHTRRHGGTGLGLAISRRLIESMGGSLGVRSKPGVGSRFSLALPLRPDNRTKTAPIDDIRARLAEQHVVIVGTQDALTGSIHDTVRPWVASSGIARDPQEFAALVNALPDGGAALLCGPPKGDRWHEAEHALHRCERSISRVAILPCSKGRGDLVRASGTFDVVFDRALKPDMLLRAICGEDPEPRRPSREKSQVAPGGRLLLVEDSAANRLVAATILEKAGYVVDIAENGQQAIEAAAHRHHDMVLMDLQMPVMDGYSAAERIRQSFEDDWRVPIVALTANVPARPQGQARAVAFDGYIAKPYSRSILLDAVASQLGPRGAREELPAGRTGADGKVLS